MNYKPVLHHRRCIRLKGYDYTQAGAYFVTILVRYREHLLGGVLVGAVQLSKSGEIVDECWREIPEHFSDVECDAYAIMPNHIHGVLVVRGVGARHASPLQRHPLRVSNWPTGPKPSSVGAIVGSFKSAATKRINRFRRTIGFVVWQRNYYEHIIRDEDSLNKIREYIFHNPARWEYDLENAAGKPDGAERDFWKIFGPER